MLAPRLLAIGCLALLGACGQAATDGLVDLMPPPSEDDGGDPPDIGVLDAGRADLGVRDLGVRDLGVRDTGIRDSGARDAGFRDAAVRDVGVRDAATTPDAGFRDASTPDTGLRDAGTPDSGFVPAPHAPLPVVPQNGGPLLHHPALVTVTLPGYSRTAEVTAYDQFIVGSRWLITVGPEYGIGAGRHVGSSVLQWMPGPQVSDTEIQTRLLDAVASGALPSAPATAEPFLYVLFFPLGTTIELMGSLSCAAFGGYHNEAHAPGRDLVYAVIPDCGGDLGEAISHELFEAATDPFPFTQPSFQYNPMPPDGWSFLGSELADACTGSSFLESNFVVQRAWSNAAARQGHDPCVPASGLPYFSVSEPVNRHTVAPGRSLTITLTGWSTAPVPDWPVLTTTAQGDFDASPSLRTMTTNNGRNVALTVSVPAGTASGASAFVIVGSGGMAEHLYPILIIAQ
ncbi:MAG: hypothetical protein U1E65_34595 [Myxococcota bacterium]